MVEERQDVTEKSQHKRKPVAAASFDPIPTQQALPYNDVEHPPGIGLQLHARLCPLSDGVCLTVHCSTARPGFVKPKHSTSPRLLPVYQRLTVRWRSCVLRRPYNLLPPLADGTCPTVHRSTANSGIANPDRCTLIRRHLSINGELYVGGVTHSRRTVRGKATVGSRWPVVTPPPHQ